MPDLKGKVAFVTAGATGIGFACAQAIVDAVGRVTICARREDTLRGAAAKLGASADWVVCDVADDASVDAAVEATQKRFGRLSLAVNSAGTGGAGPLLTTKTAEFQRVLDTNLPGAFSFPPAQAPAMQQGGGRILNVNPHARPLPPPSVGP